MYIAGFTGRYWRQISLVMSVTLLFVVSMAEAGRSVYRGAPMMVRNVNSSGNLMSTSNYTTRTKKIEYYDSYGPIVTVMTFRAKCTNYSGYRQSYLNYLIGEYVCDLYISKSWNGCSKRSGYGKSTHKQMACHYPNTENE